MNYHFFGSDEKRRVFGVAGLPDLTALFSYEDAETAAALALCRRWPCFRLLHRQRNRIELNGTPCNCSSSLEPKSLVLHGCNAA